MADYSYDDPDSYCVLCKDGIWFDKKDTTEIKEGRISGSGDGFYRVHTKCLYPAVTLVMAIKAVIKERY